MKKWQTGLLVLCSLCFVWTAFAAPPDESISVAPGLGSPGRPWLTEGRYDFGSFLRLSGEQRDRMREIRQQFRIDTHDLRFDIQAKRVEVQRLFTDPKIDDATLVAKQKELNQLIAKLMDRRAEMTVEWRKVLTPEQIQKLDLPFRHHGETFGHHGPRFYRYHHPRYGRHHYKQTDHGRRGGAATDPDGPETR
jgi:Spy/CpxP family protein refolding chaperone